MTTPPSLAAIERAARELIAALAEMNAAIDERPMNRERFDAAWDRDGQARAVYREATKDPAAVLALVERVREGERAQAERDILMQKDPAAKLDGYRELGQRAALAENERDHLRAAQAEDRDAIRRLARAVESLFRFRELNVEAYFDVGGPEFERAIAADLRAALSLPAVRRATTEHPRADAAAGEEPENPETEPTE